MGKFRLIIIATFQLVFRALYKIPFLSTLIHNLTCFLAGFSRLFSGTRPLPIYAKGKNSREWIHVNDHCEALLMLYLKGKNGENYNIGSGKNLSNVQLVNKILKIFKKNKIFIGNKVRIKFVKDRPGHDFRYSLNSNKIQKSIKWKCKINFDRGLKQTVFWYLTNKSFFKKIAKNKYDIRLGLKL